MLVWDASGDTPNIFTVAEESERRVGLYASGSYWCAINRILMRDSEKFNFLPNKLSAAMIGAFKAMGGRVVGSIETSYAQWQQYVLCAMQAVARSARSATANSLTGAPAGAVRRVKAFFVSQKVNGHNAP